MGKAFFKVGAGGANSFSSYIIENVRSLTAIFCALRVHAFNLYLGCHDVTNGQFQRDMSV